MRITALVTILAIAAAPAFAQSGATQSPPAPNSSSSAPTPATSAPAGALTTNPGSVSNPNVSGNLGGSASVPAPPASGPSDAMSKTVPTPAK